MNAEKKQVLTHAQASVVAEAARRIETLLARVSESDANQQSTSSILKIQARIAKVRKALGGLSHGETRPLVRQLDIAYNRGASLCDLFYEGNDKNLLKKKVNSFRNTITSTVDALDDLAKEEAQREAMWKDNPQQLSADDEDDEEFDPLKPSPKQIVMQKKLSSEMHKDSELLRKFAAYKSKMPRESQHAKSPFVLARAPLIGLFTPFFTKEDFERSGVEVEWVNGMYPVFEDQLVIGINSEYLKSGKMKGVLKADRKAFALQSVLDTLKVKGKNYLPVSDDVNLVAGYSGTPNFYYYWVMPPSQINALRKIKTFRVDGFGFAFN